MNIEYILDILERLEASGVVQVEWGGVEDELEAMGLCYEDDPECMEEGDNE